MTRFAYAPSLFRKSSSKHVALAALATIAIATHASSARADDTIKTPGDHFNYPFEIEPHLTLGGFGAYGGAGYGLGLRVGIPIVQNGFVPQINNSVAITFGADFVHYDACYFNNIGCGANYLLLPVALQWNFYVAKNFSVFGEPGIYIYKGFEGTVCSNVGGVDVGCGNPSTFGVLPAFSVGGRWHFSDTLALTARIGYPTISIGLSIF